jgi:aminobenzoyl-glutamate utilization protein B
VPDLAQMELVERNPSMLTRNEIWDRILKVAQGAALMTETTVDIKIGASSSNILANDALASLAQKNLEEVGGFTYTDKERDFALALQKTLPPGGAISLDATQSVEPLIVALANAPSASTDVGDVSWNVPTIGFLTATFVPGVVAHTWQAAASSGTSIGQDGMLIASRALATTAVDLFADPSTVLAAKVEFQKRTAGKPYVSAIPADQQPDPDYRSN